MSKANKGRQYRYGTAIAMALATVMTVGWSADAAATDRVILAFNPPTQETNLFWHGIGEKMPSMQSLVGNDPLTGAYDNSELAAEWSANEAFTEWTFRLHEDAEFHHGWGPVTSADVIHSYELHTGPDSTIVALAQLRAEEVEALDDHTVVFRFAEPRTDYTFQHAGRGAMVVYSKAQYDAEGIDGYHSKPAGTAAYQYVERRVGEGILFEAVPDHWQGVTPDFPELYIRFAGEPATKLALLLAGEAHIVDLPREIQGEALGAGKTTIASQNPAMHTGAFFKGVYNRTGDEAHRPDLPWGDVRIREAMNRALDREQMIEILYDGRAEPVARWGMHPPHEGYVPELAERFEEMYGYDPDRARELLAEAGYPDAFPDPVVPIIVTALTGNPEFATMAELLQVFFEDIGLQTEMREMDWASLGALARAREDYVIAPSRNAPIRPSEAGIVNFFTTRGTPYGGLEDDTIEGLADALQNEIDPDERQRLAAEAWTYLFDIYADIPLAALHFELSVDPTVVADWTFPGVTTNSVSHYHLIKAAE
jgi:peptide/nickel transport system substrate-binding protein